MSLKNPSRTTSKDLPSNQEATQPKDNNVLTREIQPNPTSNQVGYENARSLLTYNEKPIFSKQMDEKGIKVKLFLLEDQEGFESLSEKNKIRAVVNRANYHIEEWYYELGLKEKMPERYEEFKRELIRFCGKKTQAKMKKYQEERWSDFMSRVEVDAKYNGKDEEDILKTLRESQAPKEIKIIFFLDNIGLDRMKILVEDWEKTNGKSLKVQEKNYQQKEKRCYTCNQVGHLSNTCTKKTDLKKSGTNMMLEKEDIEHEDLKVNGSLYSVVIDTASSINIISKSFSNRFKVEVQKENKPIRIRLINKSEIILEKYVDLKVERGNTTVTDKFYILDNSLCDILVGKKLNEKLKESFKFPIECRIPTLKGKIVSFNRPIRNERDRVEFQKLVDNLESRGVVKESVSLWLSPVVLTRKKSGELRFCLDLQKVNDLVDLDGFDIPIIQDTIRTLHDKKYFSVIDLKDGYFQVPIHKDDAEKTTFKDAKGRLMHFTRLPQGYKNAPALFQRGMTIILKGLLEKKCVVYIDDILIYGKDVEEHNRNLEEVKERLELYGLKINETKSQICKEEIDFLGYKISYNKIKPLTKRSQGIISYTMPKTQRELRRFIGIVNYDRNFINKMSEKLKTFYRMLTDNSKRKLEWNKDSIKMFEQLKAEWSSNLELTMPNFKEDFILETDASDIGLGGVLLQNGRPVAYISRLLKGAEANYTITEKEILAAIWAMEKLEQYLMGKKFVLITDHKALTYLHSKQAFGTPRIQRWMERILRFEFDVCYKKGSEMINSDALSRSLIRQEEKEGIEFKKILEIHVECGHSKNIKDKCESAGISLSREKILEIINKRCLKCVEHDKPIKNSGKYVHTFSPGEMVSIDLMDINKKHKVLMAIDYFTRKAWAVCLGNKDPAKIVVFLEKLYSEFKFKKMLSDNGLEFKNKTIDNFCKEKEIERVYSIPHYHQGNGRIERLNRTIRSMIKKLSGNIKQRLQKAVKAYNNNTHRAIGISPNEAQKIENVETIINNIEKYEKEFKYRDHKPIEIGTRVKMLNVEKSTKMEPEYKEEGTVEGKEGKDKYTVKTNSGKVLTRHRSQLKIWAGNVEYEKGGKQLISGN